MPLATPEDIPLRSRAQILADISESAHRHHKDRLDIVEMELSVEEVSVVDLPVSELPPGASITIPVPSAVPAGEPHFGFDLVFEDTDDDGYTAFVLACPPDRPAYWVQAHPRPLAVPFILVFDLFFTLLDLHASQKDSAVTEVFRAGDDPSRVLSFAVHTQPSDTLDQILARARRIYNERWLQATEVASNTVMEAHLLIAEALGP